MGDEFGVSTTLPTTTRLRNNKSFQHFVSGYIAGALSVTTGHPFDTVKVRLQTTNIQSSAFECTKNIVKNEGFTALFKGLSPQVCVGSVLTGTAFSVYSMYCKLLKKVVNNNTDTVPWGVACVAGSLSGATLSVATCPIEVIKINMQSATGKTRLGLMECVRSIIGTHGVSGFYRGYNATLCRSVPAWGAYYGMYEWTKTQWGPGKRDAAAVQEGLDYLFILKTSISGGLTGAVSWLVCFPADAVKTRLQAPNSPYRGVVDCAVRSYRSDGIGVFYRGLIPTLVRSFPVSAVTLTCFELSNRHLFGC